MEKTSKKTINQVLPVGQKVQIAKDGYVKLPVSLDTDQEVLFVPTDSGYRLITLIQDVKRVYIEVTTKCNFACITCIRSSWQDELTHMEWSTFEKILNSLKELPDLESVHFGGFGEPLLHPRIFDMLKAVKELGLNVEMITNGSFLREEVIQKLIGLQVDVLFTSLDSPEEEEYNEIRQGANFQSVYSNIVNLQAMKRERRTKKPELGIEFVAMKKNFDRLPKLIRMAWDLKASQVIVTNLLPYHESMKDEIVYDTDDTGAMFGCHSYESLLISLKANMSNMKLRTERYCKFVQDKSLCINHKGNVSPCYPLMHTYQCYVYGRQKQMYPCYLGNVNEKTLREIWMDSGYVNFRQTVNDYRFPSCTDCRMLDGCNYTDSNEMDCWANSPSCAECLWARRIIACP
ncbi:tungsten cofactor oxidoreductase radical SAM maturase [Sporomusa sp. KB1]|jgi:tungsten cofactor oxidoreducase radical SAM maturase|uniref:tungsten cofactor oxidoreductase radical SAM maturase n=1 Tax=Sporomusa sp. KB1 TaxID=943346 RepID=UPI0011A44F6E|nr:tungsten cofactor oxidoreductase radical SAM maturase [Sporomusa sp. KB1]TWH51848.1 tungsten cofactor oxidoreductase radical SAM maturase [Sporomusa sp. KB1]